MLADWLVIFSFCVDVIDGAHQCSISQVISGDVDGIIHRHSLLLRGVQALVLIALFVLRGLLGQVINIFTKSGIQLLGAYHYLTTNQPPFAKTSRSLQEGSTKPSRSVSSKRLHEASKASPRTLRGGCIYRRLHEDALEGSRGLLEESVDELGRIST